MKLQIITPAKLVKEVEVTQVTLPTVSGEITVLPKHQPLLTLLEEGIVVYKTKNVIEDLAIGGGYAQTDGLVIRVLVSRAYGQDEIDEKMTLEALNNAKKILQESKDVGERSEAQALLRRSIVDSKLIKRRHHGVSSTSV